ncbi:MAG: hypothetical protein IPJ76_12135 [Flavobacteriales bacterium]|nr:MAG: hypothetical protein IPJ76_12135 [Flavobacteriales bacterium]
MSFITQLAERFNEENFDNVDAHGKFISQAKGQISAIDSKRDRIEFLTVVLEENRRRYDEHKPKCGSPSSCQLNFAHESVGYFLTQELTRLGAVVDEDAFTPEEKDAKSDKLDQVLNDLSSLKAGQGAIWTDMQEQLDELRSYFFLGKKKWYRLAAGTFGEMVLSGMISESVSKGLLSELNKASAHLLGQ